MDTSHTNDCQMKITSIRVGTVRLPFRFSFKHSLATRDYSLNTIVAATIETERGSSFLGWGESVARDYVTGETAASAVSSLKSTLAPHFLGREFSSAAAIVKALQTEFQQFGLEKTAGGASWCALELALLDAAARAETRTVA